MRASAGCLVLAALIFVACEVRRPVGEACIKDSDCETDYCRGSICHPRPGTGLVPGEMGGQYNMGGGDGASGDGASGGGGFGAHGAGGLGGGVAGAGGLSSNG